MSQFWEKLYSFRQRDRETHAQTERQTKKQTDRQVDRQTDSIFFFDPFTSHWSTNGIVSLVFLSHWWKMKRALIKRHH